MDVTRQYQGGLLDRNLRLWSFFLLLVCTRPQAAEPRGARDAPTATPQQLHQWERSLSAADCGRRAEAIRALLPITPASAAAALLAEINKNPENLWAPGPCNLDELLFFAKNLHQPRLAPFFATLADASDNAVQLHGIQGLADLRSKKLTPERALKVLRTSLDNGELGDQGAAQALMAIDSLGSREVAAAFSRSLMSEELPERAIPGIHNDIAGCPSCMTFFTNTGTLAKELWARRSEQPGNTIFTDRWLQALGETIPGRSDPSPKKVSAQAYASSMTMVSREKSPASDDDSAPSDEPLMGRRRSWLMRCVDSPCPPDTPTPPFQPSLQALPRGKERLIIKKTDSGTVVYQSDAHRDVDEVEVLPDDKSILIYESRMDGDAQRYQPYYFQIGEAQARPLIQGAVTFVAVSPDSRHAITEGGKLIDLKQWETADLQELYAPMARKAGLLEDRDDSRSAVIFLEWREAGRQALVEQRGCDRKGGCWKIKWLISLP